MAMNSQVYPSAVREELERLASLVTDREMKIHLSRLTRQLLLWRRGKISAKNALETVRMFNREYNDFWSSDIDPGLPVANALSQGILKRDDISDTALEAIEDLIALIDI